MAAHPVDRKIDLASWLHARINQTGGRHFASSAKLCSYVWKALIKMRIFSADPIVKRQVGKNLLFMNASHKLPNKLRRLAYYDSALPRISTFLTHKDGRLVMIDIGANIGDTVNLVSDASAGTFLCVEPNETYFQLLKMNTRNLENVICEQAIISEAEDATAGRKALREHGGTAHLTTDKSVLPQDINAATTVDKLAGKYTIFKETNLLKIDTDGYDIKVLRSARSLLTTVQPLVFVEVSPWHLKNIGNDDPMDLFTLVRSFGYFSVLFYDNHGYPAVDTTLDEIDLLGQMISYAGRRSNLWYDVLIFPESKKNEADEFFQHEVEHFPEIG